jgi:hypothetical protein
MADNKGFIPVSLNMDTLKNNPELIQVRNAGNFTLEEQTYLDGMAKLSNLNYILSTDSDPAQAKDNFARLDPNIQKALIGLNPEADYHKPNENVIKKYLFSSKLWVTNPLRSLEKIGKAYISAVENTALNVLNAGNKIKESVKAPFAGAAAIEKVTSGNFWSEGWNGYNKWNQEGIERLDNEYNPATGVLVRGILDGKNVLDIFREYGTIDDDMANAYFKVGTPEFQEIVDRYSRQKINIGSRIVDWAGKFAPYKEKPSAGDMVRDTFASAVLSIGGMRGVKRNKYGEFVTEKLFGQGYGDPSTGLDIAATFYIDPLTYVTFGGSRGLATFQSVKTADELKSITDGALKVKRVQELFQEPAFVAKSESFLTDLNSYRDALNKNNVLDAGRARTKIALDHPEYDDDNLLGLLVQSTVKKAGEEVPVTDMDTWFRWFETGENLNYLINGKVNNIITFREGSVALQTRTRKMVNGLRANLAKVFHGLDRDMVIGAKPLPGELVETWADVEKAMLSRPNLSAANTPEEMLNLINKNDSVLDSLVKPKNYARKDIARAFGEQLARMPAEGIQIFWAESLVDKSIDALRSYVRLITGDRLRAEFIVQQYKMASKADRINMMFNLDKLWLDSAGAAFTPQGIELRDAILQSRYINTELASIADYTADVPSVFNKFQDIETLPPGPSAFFHTTEGITLMPFDNTLKDIYNSMGGGIKGAGRAAEFKYGKGTKNLIKKIGYMYYSGSTNTALSKAINRGIVFMLLFPKLGIKAAADEATILANVSSPGMLFDFLSGKGRKISNIQTAITGNNTSQGLVKEAFLNLVGRNPAKFRTAAERKYLQGMKEVEIEFVDESGRLVKQKEIVTAEEYFGKSPEEILVQDAVAKYGKGISDKDAKWLQDYFLLTGDNVSDSIFGSIIGATFGDSMALSTGLAKEMYGKSVLTQALEKNGRKILSKPYLDKYNQLTQAEKNLAHFKYFYLLFSKNKKYGVNLPELFFQTNALKTEKDVDTFVQYAMSSFGWNKLKPKPDLAKKINDTFGQSSILRNAGKTEEEISKIIILNAAKEMRHVFHGGSGFNENLLKLIQDKVWAAKEKVNKSQAFAEKRMLQREAAGVGEVLSAQELLKREKYYRESITYTKAIDKITDEEFYEAIKGFELTGPIKTDIDFDAIAAFDKNQPNFIDKVMSKGWDWMDRQVNDVVRSDIFMLKMLEQRSLLEANEELLVKHLISEGATPDNAAVQASTMMANQAMHNAADEMLKYVDNPALRSQLAFNMRVIGRFIRAAEDYSKRTLRWMLRHPESIPYRIGHLGHAADGSGITYDDQDGNKYVVIPNDGLFWQDIAPAIVMLANPLYSITALGKMGADKVLNGTSIKDSPYWGFFKQAEWNQYTLKVSLLNPSYSEDAGTYTFTGPNMSVPIAGIRDFLVGVATKNEAPNLYNFGLSLDNILLGQVADNTNLLRSTIPPAISNYYKFLTGDYKDNQGAIAAYQAISMIQYNDKTRKRPEDFLNKEGVYDASKAQEFLNSWRIQTANILGNKAAANTIFGAPLQLGSPDIPNYLRKNGTVTFTKEYGDILRGVLQFNQENGFPLGDPYTVAVALHAQERPDKLIFQVNKDLKESKVAINYTQETLTWAIANRKFVEKFPNAGWIFAPNIGEYDPKVISYMQAADLLPPDKDPFDWNNKALRQYIEKTTVAKLISEYYQYDRDAENLLNDPNNPNRNFSNYRQEVKANAAAQKEALLNSNPLFKAVQGRENFQTVEELRSHFNELRTIVSDENYPKGVTPETKKLLKTMVRSASELLIVAETKTVSGQYMGDTELERQVTAMYSEYKKIAGTNAILGEAWSGVIQPLLDKVYDIPFRVVRKPGD